MYLLTLPYFVSEYPIVSGNSDLGNFQGLDIRIQKAHLQTILKAAYIHRDRKIEVEFRG